MLYIRYADEFIVTFLAPPNSLSSFQAVLRVFLQKHLKLTLYDPKITNLEQDKILFLGTWISLGPPRVDCIERRSRAHSPPAKNLFDLRDAWRVPRTDWCVGVFYKKKTRSTSYRSRVFWCWLVRAQAPINTTFTMLLLAEPKVVSGALLPEGLAPQISVRTPPAPPPWTS